MTTRPDFVRLCCVVCGGDTFYLEGEPLSDPASFDKPAIQRTVCAGCGGVALKNISQEERRNQAMERCREATRLRAEGLTLQEVGERLGVVKERGRQLIQRFQRRHGKWGNYRVCSCPTCCKGLLFAEIVNEDTRETFERQHPVIAEARALLVADPEHGEAAGLI